MTAKLGALVRRAASAFGANLDASVEAAITTWLARLSDWNARMDLTAARSPEELVDLMLADALVLSSAVALSRGAAPLSSRGAPPPLGLDRPRGLGPAPGLEATPGAEAVRVVDVGTGAGAPGLALALLRPDLRVTLVEPKGKRASFLRSVIGELDRPDVRIERARGEALAEGAWDVAVSRATLPPAEWLALGARLVAPGGVVWVLVAAEAPPTSPHTTGGARPNVVTLEGDVPYTWPLTGVSRRAVAYRAAFLAHPPAP